ncbi:tetraacyldisaccharide 4'-kinase [Desulfobacula sp.]|uniref:tetraacyldisaccharide 4'-kinase n=1 Tax=Desulfobacula sp. TaxID=2593537 RepID=UPI0025BBA134|nr:tetraacyldisaccharide 4'-kinase [Desulfobacula sp.]MBC2703059.1 tetraacyldisaccharide 4'-kinase [Desulfobacula sp.]
MIDKLTTKIQYIMESHQATRGGLSLERLLYGLSKVYETGIQFRNSLYKTGILKSRELPCFVISIGNISTGGTGKTPMTIYLSKYLTALDYKVAVVTRGYKGNLEHKGGVVSNGNKILCSPKEAGDEPYMMAQILKLPVIVGKKKFESGMTAIKKFSPDIIVLDDAFQHLALKRNLNLLLINAKKMPGNRYLIPRGTLREPVSSIHRSDATIVTHSDRNQNTVFEKTDIGSQDIPLFKCNHIPYISIISLKEKDTPQSNLLNDIKGKRTLLFSGIANNSDFKTSCDKMGLKVHRHIEFPDHHRYTQYDIDRIMRAFKQSKADYIITTAKDYIKISDDLPLGCPLVVLNVRIEFDDNNKIAFELFIKNKLQKYFGGSQGPD